MSCRAIARQRSTVTAKVVLMMQILTTASAMTFPKMRSPTAMLHVKRMPLKSISPRTARSRWQQAVRAVSLASMSLELPLSYPV